MRKQTQSLENTSGVVSTNQMEQVHRHFYSETLLPQRPTNNLSEYKWRKNYLTQVLSRYATPVGKAVLQFTFRNNTSNLDSTITPARQYNTSKNKSIKSSVKKFEVYMVLVPYSCATKTIHRLRFSVV